MQTGPLAMLSNVKFKRIFHFERAIRANLHGNKRILKWRPFWNKVYDQISGFRENVSALVEILIFSSKVSTVYTRFVLESLPHFRNVKMLRIVAKRLQ